MVTRLLNRLRIDPYVLSLLGTVLLASLLPARGIWASIAGLAADAGIVLLFFLHGARLSTDAVLAGARNLRLHGAVAVMTFVVFPALGLAIAALPGIDPSLAQGMLFLTLLPSTIQSSVAFTAMAGGNVAAALCSASLSNLAGMAITPVLVGLLMTGRSGGFSGDAVLVIAGQLLLPFLAGHGMRRWIGGWITRRKAVLTYVDRGSILLVVYTAVGAAVVDGLWDKLPLDQLATMLALCAALLAAVLALSSAMARWLRLDRADSIVLQFCGSKKSLASGVPIAGALFAPAAAGAIVIPLILFHQIQLMVCAVLARRYARQSAASAA